ncbi:DUF2846 domain-containing protein [Parendozoicomonas sp. Alg238-R29]|uniref:DUF2846 domain-containing protein n=1 Tax=Parendozoicomonas sp. Alg238-R29 TaxID=2993446 RepID=UPI00248EA59C|nr:DUF2846 domain-containing protein [Parendozoicomonas sp. Alg238-R29]
MIRKFVVFSLLLAGLSGCTSMDYDRSFGAFLKPVDGPKFKPVPQSPENRSYLIVYRPYSEWAEEELEAPSVYINGEAAVNVRSNGYALFSMEPGQYQVVVKRPAFGQDLFFMEDTFLENQPVNFNRIGGFVLDAKGGETYYLRYSELTSPPYDPNAGESLLGDGPMQFISWKSAKNELMQSRRLQPLKLVSAPDIDVAQEQLDKTAETSSWWWF